MASVRSSKNSSSVVGAAATADFAGSGFVGRVEKIDVFSVVSTTVSLLPQGSGQTAANLTNVLLEVWMGAVDPTDSDVFPSEPGAVPGGGLVPTEVQLLKNFTRQLLTDPVSVQYVEVADAANAGVLQATVAVPCCETFLVVQVSTGNNAQPCLGRVEAYLFETVLPTTHTISNSALPTGGATSALQTLGNTTLTAISGKITACDTGAVTVATSALPTTAATDALQTAGNGILSAISGKITACNTGAVTVAASALPANAATAAGQVSQQTLQSAGNGSLAAISTRADSIQISSASAATSMQSLVSAGVKSIGNATENNNTQVQHQVNPDGKLYTLPMTTNGGTGLQALRSSGTGAANRLLVSDDAHSATQTLMTAGAHKVMVHGNDDGTQRQLKCGDDGRLITGASVNDTGTTSAVSVAADAVIATLDCDGYAPLRVFGTVSNSYEILYQFGNTSGGTFIQGPNSLYPDMNNNVSLHVPNPPPYVRLLNGSTAQTIELWFAKA